MNLTTSTIITAGVVIMNTIVNDKGIEAKFVVGTLMYLLFVTTLNETAPQLARTFAVAVMITVVFLYFPNIAKKVGLTK